MGVKFEGYILLGFEFAGEVRAWQSRLMPQIQFEGV
jgi:hypothetical protein